MSSPHRRPLRLGTRGSPLALVQAGQIARQLREPCGQPIVLVTMATPSLDAASTALPGPGRIAQGSSARTACKCRTLTRPAAALTGEVYRAAGTPGFQLTGLAFGGLRQ